MPEENKQQQGDDERFILYPKTSSFTIIESESTIVQEETEDECKPFLVDLRTLDMSQLNHLRSVGLLPPYQVEEDKEEESEDDEEEMVEVKEKDWESKAHKVLGIDDLNAINNDSDDDDDEGSPRIVLLDEKTQSTSAKQSSPLPSSAFDIQLLREKHRNYLQHPHLYSLPASYVSLDASRPWIIYWTLHSLDLLCELPHDYILVNVVDTLDKCWQRIEVELSKEEYHTLLLLDKDGKEDNSVEKGADKIKVKAGGYGGGPGQLAHGAPTYAAVLTLSIIAANDPTSKSSQMAMESLRKRRIELYAWFLSLRYFVPSSIASSFSPSTKKPKYMTGYRMHHDGEVDVRASYTIFTVTSLLNITTYDLTNGAALYISACQTFEGGFGSEPFNEAHGGYTFCALGALALLLQSKLDHVEQEVEINWSKLRKWLVSRQMSYEGGFNGRCNKLVDGCYSFWQGSSLATLDVLEYASKHPEMSQRDVCGDYGFASGIYIPSSTGKKKSRKKKQNYGNLNFDQLLLQRYILLCAQDVNGGLRDKPSKSRDYYHSCYNLSGLSVSQHVLSCIDNDNDETTEGDFDEKSKTNEETGEAAGDNEEEDWTQRVCCYGDKNVNVVAMTHPTFNIRVERVKFILDEFHSS